MRSCLRYAVVAAGTFALGEGIAHAQGFTDHERAIAAFEEARKHIEAGDCEQALPRLEDSLHLEPSVGALMSLADCTSGADPLKAYWHLRDAALIAYLKHDDRRADAERRAAALLPRLAAVEFSIAASALARPEFVLQVDGKPIDRFHVTSGPLAFAPGQHVLEASAGDLRWSESVILTEGTVDKAHVDLVAPRPPEPPPVVEPPPREPAPPPPTERDPHWRTFAVALAGSGVASLAVGAAFGIATLDRRSDLAAACGGDLARCTGTTSEVDSIRSSASTLATASSVTFAVGGVLIATGAVLWLLAPHGRATTFGKAVGASNGLVVKW